MRSFLYCSVLCSFVFLSRTAVIRDTFSAEGGLASGRAQHRRTEAQCQPFSSTFTEGLSTQFTAISPADSYMTTSNGLQMLLKKPEGTITTQGHVNSAIGAGATINSTFLIQYGKVTFEMQTPGVAGSVTAAILISDGHDEIDVELVGGDQGHWQTNVFAPSPKDAQPLWSVFGALHDVSSITEYHNYTVDWSESRIIWSVDGNAVRTLTPDQTDINGAIHYPTQLSRIQLGIWDASSPEGTSEWANGPINWQTAPSTITATVKSVRVECD